MLVSWVIGLLLLATVRGGDVCYEPLGCFSDEAPWTGILQRPLKLFPWAPKDIDTRFLLYTNENPNNYQRISALDLATVEASNFQLERKTRFIIHGFIDKGEESWLTDMCKKMFQVEEVNCICVDWRRGAKADYTQAVHNIRVVGAEIALLVQGLTVKPPGPTPWGGAERGQRGARKHQGAPRGAWGLAGRARPEFWRQRGIS